DLRLDVSLKRLVANFEQATGISIHLLLSDQIPALSTAHRLALYRTTQESLTNVQRHAQAKQVWLQLARRDDTITLRVSDNGVGYPKDTPETGFGLRGIQERVAQLGGQLRFETRPGGGAQLWLSLPLVLEGTNV
ncbi:MAG: sensor histidine kinase, partial [Gammaproteobacteria bacterium]|nr:sensor histidine kinase [Gammaproteobacteria bacterium]